MTGKAIFLHLSDLHFGDENETNSAKRVNTLDKLLLTLKNLPTEWKPQSITISGDIGWHGLEKDYKIAETWLKKLLKTLDLSAGDIIPAPGNHDINLEIAADTPAPSESNNADELLDLDSLEKASAPFKAFEDFCKKMNLPPFSLGSKSSYLAGSRVHNGIAWLVLNSAWFCRDGRKEKLHIGLPHLEVITAAETWKKRGLPTIGVLHHPPPCLQDEELNSYGSRRNTYDFLAGECDMILSGHVHGMLKAPDTMYQRSYLFTGGSCYSDERVRNNFSIFRVDISSGVIERRAYEWNPGDGEWEYREKYSTSFPGGEAGANLHRRLFMGSRRHYEDLRGENGRFRHLDISDIILQQPNKEWLDFPIKSFVGSRGGFSKEPLAAGGTFLDVLPLLWQEGCKHAVVKGDGGMGKTVSLVRLWDEFTKHYDAARPVPVFIQLNEINTVPEEKRMDFILSTIRKDYFDNRLSKEEILRFLREPRDVPAVVLLLDGFNEVTVDNGPLLIQLRKLMEQARGVQVVITSRFDMRTAYGWEHLHLLELRGLEEKQVREYLEKKKSKMPTSRLPELLRNPMMLTLYTSTCEVQGKLEGAFKEKVETAGELLWNFMEAQVAVLLERLNYDKKKWWFYKFLLKFMLPTVGYEMEKAGFFALDRDTLYGVLDTYCSRFSRDDFFETFAGYDDYEEALPLGACRDDKARRKQRREIVDILCNKLLMLVKEGETFRFLHQDFRDYFAALHILHEAEMGVKRGEVADVLKQRALPVYIRRFMGEIEGEHYQKPVFQARKGWLQKENRDSLLNRVLNLCRGVFDGSVGFGPWNIIEVWKEVRGELSGAELSKLDLSRVVLNGTHCSRFYKSDYLAANFNRSLLHEMSIFPQGHSGKITSAVYSGDGEKILSASVDKTIKEWDVESSQCLKTFTGHERDVTSARYGGDGKKILSASFDNTIREWDVKSGKCLKTFTGHKDTVWSTHYSGNGEKIASTSADKTIKEWDVKSGKCLNTFTGHENVVTSAHYNGDGKKIISTSHFTIKEWDVESGKCLRTFIGHTNWITSAHYSFGGEKILSASYDKTIKEWDVKSGRCLKTFTGHTDQVRSALYSGDGKKILSASFDNTIKEWDVESGKCLKTFTGHEGGVISSHYKVNGKKIISAAGETIKEWDVESGKCLKTFTGHQNLAWSAFYSGDGKRILSAWSDKTIKEWDAKSGQCLKTFTGHTAQVKSAHYSSDEKKIISASWDKTIKEWDVENGKCLKTFTGHKNWVNSAHYSVDGKKIVSASQDDIIKEWDVASGKCLRTCKGKLKAVENPGGTGKKLLAYEDKIVITDEKTGKTIRTFINIPGLFIQGCSFKNLHPDSDLSEESKNRLRQYGARL